MQIYFSTQSGVRTLIPETLWLISHVQLVVQWQVPWFFRIRRFPGTWDFPCYNQKVPGKPVWPLGEQQPLREWSLQHFVTMLKGGGQGLHPDCAEWSLRGVSGQLKRMSPLQEKVPAQILVRVWMTIHLCSKELVDVSKMFRKISLKKTCMARRR